MKTKPNPGARRPHSPASTSRTQAATWRLCMPRLAVAGLAAALSTASATADDGRQARPGTGAALPACTAIVDRVARLACFDAAFQTPVEGLPDGPRPTGEAAAPPPGPLRRMAETLLAGRRPQERGWILRWRASSAAALQPAGTVPPVSRPADETQAPDIFLLTVNEEGAELMVSCDNNITTLAIVLGRPVPTLQTRVGAAADVATVAPEFWRDLEDGYVLTPGRGLPSIDMLRGLAGARRLQLQVWYPQAPRAYLFDVAGLGDNLPAVRAACRW